MHTISSHFFFVFELNWLSTGSSIVVNLFFWGGARSFRNHFGIISGEEISNMYVYMRVLVKQTLEFVIMIFNVIGVCINYYILIWWFIIYFNNSVIFYLISSFSYFPHGKKDRGGIPIVCTYIHALLNPNWLIWIYRFREE